MRRSNQSKKAFTIVELLTVMGVIAILIGLLVPALNIVRRIAKDTKQKAQFHSIEVALEIFKNDDGEYPPSSAIDNSTESVNKAITGAQRLAEALVGRDLQGFDPFSKWHPELDKAIPTYAYEKTDTDQKELSLQRRRGPYLRLENVGAFNIDQLYPKSSTEIYGETAIAVANNDPAPFITDVFADKPITVSFEDSTGATVNKTVKAGTPVLYFRANPSIKNLGIKSNAAYTARTYNVLDNYEILLMGRMLDNKPNDNLYAHYFIRDNQQSAEYAKFYEAIKNPQVASDDGVSFNADSFILMSAGKDGFFGTADDVYNFGE